MLGDSFDLHACAWLQETFNASIINKNIPRHLEPVWKNCYEDKHISVNLFRFSGLIRSVSDLNSSIVNYVVNEQPNVVTIGSFAWDLKQIAELYCKERLAEQGENATLLIRCTCDYGLFLSSKCISIAQPQVFNGLAIPWCNNEFINKWIESYHILIKLIRQRLPRHTKIFLRNQPMASRLLMGNQFCLGQMNAAIFEIAQQLKLEEIGGHHTRENNDVGCRLLNMNALMMTAQHHLGHGSNKLDDTRYDGLHYFTAAHMWTNYLINTVIDNL
jgi:hypothetical protein